MNKYQIFIIFFISAILNNLLLAQTPIFQDNFNSGTLSSKYRTLKAQGGFTPKVVNKRLRLTNRKHDLSTAVTLDWEFPTKNNKFTLEFDYYAYGGCQDGNDYVDKSAGKWGADGLSIILFDSSVGMTPTVGASGGSLGYADGYIEMTDGSHAYQYGFQKAWLGIGLDEFGSFTVNDEGRKDINGNTLSHNDLEHNEKPNSVGIRGSADSGYRLLAYKNNLSPRLARYIYKKSESKKKKSYHSGKYRLTVDSTLDSHLYIKLERNTGKGYKTIINNFDAMKSKYHQGSKPKNFRLAFSSGTGGGCNIHEIDNLKIYGKGWEYGKPKISISDAKITEGDSGTKDITFAVSLDKEVPSGKQVKFDYETIDTGSATSGVDFIYKKSTVTINPGNKKAYIKIKIKGDTTKENDETFKIKLTNPKNAVFEDDEAIGKIIDDDSSNITGICYALPDDRNKLITFYPSPGASPLPTPQTISLSTEFNGEGSAYRATDGKIYAFKNAKDSDNYPSTLYQVDPNTGQVKKIKKNLLPYSVEGAEFYIDPSSGEETLYVIAKEYHSKLYAFDPNNKWSLKSGYPKDIHGDTTSLDSIAINPHTGEAYGTDDYNYDGKKPKLYKINLSTGATTFLTRTDSVVDAEGLAYAADGNLYIENELNSKHRIYKLNPSTGALTEAVNYNSVSGDFEAISCNGGDANLLLKANKDLNITEGDSGYKLLNITFKLNRAVPPGKTVSIDYQTKDITATAGSDYESKTGKITINSGNDTGSISIKILGDTTKEDNETFSINLSDKTGNVVIPDPKIIVTIIDDDKNSTIKLSGKIYEDILGDHTDMKPVNKAKVKLFKDNGNGYLDNQDKFITLVKTTSEGKYEFSVQQSGTYFISVVSKSIYPNAELNSGYSIDDVWPEQTFAPKGGLCADGSGGTHILNQQGSCYGGRRGTLSDDYSNLGKIEHIAKIEVKDKSITDINFGFSFNVVTNLNDSDNLQGSLRQFIKNANAIKGANHMRFIPSVPKNENSWWKISLNSSLPIIKDDKTVIDGTAYNPENPSSILNHNSGNIGASGQKVGTGNDGIENSGDEKTLPNFEKPELEIDAKDKFASLSLQGVKKGVFILKSSNSIIKRVSIFNAALNNNENDDKNPAILIAGGDNNKIEETFIGARADGSDPGAGKRVNNAIYHRGNSALITKNYIAYIHYTGIWASSESDITYNHLYYPAYEPYGDGITYEDSNGDTINIKYNKIENAEAYGIEGWGADSSVLIENNTISSNGKGSSNPANGGENGGVRIYGNNNIVRFNVIKNHPGAGVVVASGKGNLISKNSFYGNQGLSIDIDQTHISGNINGDGVNPNDGKTSLSIPNKGLDYPIITSVVKSGNYITVKGYIGKESKKIKASHTIEFYKALNDGNSNGEIEKGDGKSVPHGKGKWYLGSCQSANDGTFNCKIKIPSGISYNQGELLTAIAIDQYNNTSEYGCMKDEKVSVSINDASITEGDSGEKNLNFTVTFSKSSNTQGISFKYKTQDLTAKTSDHDYKQQPETSIVLESIPNSYTISIPIYGDTKVENNETFKVILYDISSNGVFADQEAIGTIINDDELPTFDKETCDARMFNTGYDGHGGKKSPGERDSYWEVGKGDASGYESVTTWEKAYVVGNAAPGAWVDSPYNNAEWISYSTDGKHKKPQDWHDLDMFFRYRFNLDSSIDPSQFALDLKFYADNNVYEIYVNGVPQSQYTASLPQYGSNYEAPGYREGNEAHLILNHNWKNGENTIIVHIKSTASHVGFLVQNATEECDGSTPFTCDNTMYISSSIKRGSGSPEGNKIWLHSIDTSSHPFAFNVIGDAYNKTYNAIGYNPKDNFIYGIYGNKLLKIGSNGKVVSLGTVQGLPSYQLYSGTFDKDGYYYVAGKYDDSDPHIYKIDISQKKVIKKITMSENMIIYDFAFSKDGKYLYAIPPNGKFSKIAIPSGQVTHIGQNHTNYSFDAVFVDNEGRVFANDSYGGGFFEFDPKTGEKFFLSSSQRAQLNDGTNCPNASFIFTDFGDAPVTYGVAKHYLFSTIKIGDKEDHDPSSYDSEDALGDDNNDQDDEDGIKVNGQELNGQNLLKGETYNIEAKVTGSGYLSGWIDLNRDGDFNDLGEKVLSDKNISSATHTFAVKIPINAKTGQTFARFRFSTQKNLTPTGTAIDGEDEDYLIYIDENDYNITVSDANITEGNLGEEKTINFTVSVSKAPKTKNIKVTYKTVDDTAKAGIDYTAKSGFVIFKNNITDINISVTVHGNNMPEGNKQFFIELTDAKMVNHPEITVNIEDGEGVGTIINDDHGSMDVIDEGISLNSYQSGKGLKTKIVNKPFKLKVLYMPNGSSIGNFYTPNPMIPTMPILLFLEENGQTSILKDSSGNPITATMIPGSSAAVANAPTIINRSIKNAKIKMKYVDLYLIYNQTTDPCIINNINQGNIKAMPQCVNSPNKYKNIFGNNAYNRCILNNGQPCKASKHGIGNYPYNHIYGCYECTADALGNVITSSDNFAVRPKKFKIDFSPSGTKIKAKENFTLSFSAQGQNGVATNDYNETNGTSFFIDYNETKAGCIKGVLALPSSLQFTDGNLSINTNYNETGSIKIEIKERNGYEFAKIDEDDTPSSLRLIQNDSININFIPDHFDLSWSLDQEGRNFTYYSNDLTHMGAKFSLIVKAKNKNNQITKNYDGKCYAKDSDLNITFDIDSLESSLKLKYLDKNMSGVIQTGGVFNPPATGLHFQTQIKDSNFTQGEASKIYKISFERDNTKGMLPSIIEIKKVKIKDEDQVSGQKTISNQKALFYYGRINTVDTISDINPVKTKIYYEVYCKDCNSSTKTKYKIDGNTSIDSIFWYQNIYHNTASCGNIINTQSVRGTTTIHINPVFINGTQEINMTNSNAPYQDIIRLTPSGWLTPVNTFSIPYLDFIVNFLNANTTWAGKGKLGHTIDEKISVKKNRKIDW